MIAFFNKNYSRPQRKSCGRFYFMGLLVLCSFTTRAQLMDDLSKCFTHKPSFYGTWDSRYTFISNRAATVSSVKAGLDYAAKGKIGIGYNWYKGKLERSYTVGDSLVDYRYKLRYVTLFFEYAYFSNSKWEASIPVQVGLGWVSYDRTSTSKKDNEQGRLVALYEPMSTIQYRFFKYFAAGAGMGFRLALTRNDRFFENLNSPVFVIRTKIYFGDLFRAVFGKEPRELL